MSFIVAAGSLGRLRSFLGATGWRDADHRDRRAGLAEQVAEALQRAGDEVTVDRHRRRARGGTGQGGPARRPGRRAGPSTLEAAGALRADVLVACTRSDEDNLVISLLAKRHFNVPGWSPG